MVNKWFCLESYILFVKKKFFLNHGNYKLDCLFKFSLCFVSYNSCEPWRITLTNTVNSMYILFPSELCKLYFC